MRPAEFAGFWVRLAAYLLDSVIVFFALIVVRLAVSGFMAAVKGTVLGGNILFQYDLKDIILYVAEALYFILCTYYTGTTLGKKAMNLRVVRADGEEKLGLLTVIYRETVGRFLSSVIMGIGYLMIGIDKEKRGIHDILCDTRVVYAKKIKVFKMETAFVPFAEPMGRMPDQEQTALPETYTMRMTAEKTEPETVSAENKPQMPWDAPYTGQGKPQVSKVQEEQEKPQAPEVQEEQGKPQVTEVQTEQEKEGDS